MEILFCAVWKLASVVQNKGGLLQGWYTPMHNNMESRPNISDLYYVRVKYSIENALH